MNDRYYREEYNYLVEQGLEFAHRHPDLARQLNIADARGRDPNVERLLEGFAFLTSRIRQRLDDDFPELVEGLLDLIWPHHGRPIPSFCLVEFHPAAGKLTQAVDIPAGAELESEPVGSGVRCRYRTCAPVHLFPLTLSGVRAEALGSASRLSLDFSLPPGAQAEALDKGPLRIQLFGELTICHQVYDLLLGLEGQQRHLHKVRFQARHAGGTLSYLRGPEVVQAAGFQPQESLLPLGEPSFRGFNLLMEYFLFPEKFLAFNLQGLEPLAGLQALQGFSVDLLFNRQWPVNLRLSQRELRLGCVPAANLFPSDGEPIRLDHLHSSYKVQVDTQNPEMYQVFSVDRVEGVGHQDGHRRIYQPFMAARRRLSGPAEDLEGPYYVLNRKRSPWGGLDVYLSIMDPAGKGHLPQEETLSLSLTCSNGNLGSEPLPGQINQAIAGVPEGILPRNLTQPIAPVFPRPGARSLWSWLSHASLNYLDLASAERLRLLLSLFALRRDEANLRRIEGIRSAKLKRAREMIGASLVTGNLLALVLEEDHFSGPGDVQLFCRVLAAFLETYASINSFIRLVVALAPSGKRLYLERSHGLTDAL